MVEDPEAIRAEQSLLMERVHGELRSERIIQLEERLEEQAKLFPRLLQLEAAVQELAGSNAPGDNSGNPPTDNSGNPPTNAQDVDVISIGKWSCKAFVKWSLGPPESSVVGGVPMQVIHNMRQAVKHPSGRWSDLRATLSLILPYGIFACQLILLAIVSEAGTSRACSPATQEGCHRGMYCSQSFAKGQCFDCHQVLAEPFASALQRSCPSDLPFKYSPSDSTLPPPYNSMTFPGACAMYATCIGQPPGDSPIEAAEDDADKKLGRKGRRLSGVYPDVDVNRCDYLVVAAFNMKVRSIRARQSE